MKRIIRKIAEKVNQLSRLLFDIEFVQKKYYKPIYLHKNQAGDGRSLSKYVGIIERHTDFDIQTFFEVGANYCQDAGFVHQTYNLSKKDIYCFEPAKFIYDEIKENGFKVFKYAVSDTDGQVKFRIAETDRTKLPANSGISSLKRNRTEHVYEVSSELVQSIKLSTFVKEHGIEAIDYLKVDVEGNDYEVLTGLESDISIVKIIQIECSRKPIFEGEKTFDEIYNYLIRSNFSLIHFELSSDNVSGDALFINNVHLNDKKKYE